MAKWQQPKRKALQAIPRVVDNTDAMGIEQGALSDAHRSLRKSSDQPGGPGTFAPYGNTGFRK